jgi:hypothetical protein
LICAGKGKNTQEIMTTTQQTNNLNNEVPPQDAQLQGVVFNGINTTTNPNKKCFHKMHNFKGQLKINARSNERASTGKCTTSNGQ